MSKKEDELTTIEAAQKAGVTVNAIQKAIARRKLKARKRGRDLFITVTEFENWKNGPRKPGRPKTGS